MIDWDIEEPLDLLRMQITRENKSKPLIIADPAFGEPALAQIAHAGSPSKVNSSEKRRSKTSASSLDEVYFAPLDGTEIARVGDKKEITAN